MTPEEILTKLIKSKNSSEESKLMGAASLITANRSKELNDTSILLAKTTEIAAILLAKTTEESARQVRQSNEIAVKRMEILTVAVILVGVIPAILAIVELFKIIMSLRR